jgi:hypothetical protein
LQPPPPHWTVWVGGYEPPTRTREQQQKTETQRQFINERDCKTQQPHTGSFWFSAQLRIHWTLQTLELLPKSPQQDCWSVYWYYYNNDLPFTMRSLFVYNALNRNVIYLMGAILASLLFVVTYHSYVEPNESDAWMASLRRDNGDGITDDAIEALPSFRDSVAVLITGQCHRFVYRDQLGRNSDDANLDIFTINPALPRYGIDVYIVLQCGHKQEALFGTVDTPPYMESVNVTDIEEWYLAKGADTVSVQLLYDDTLDASYEDITQAAMNVYGNYYEFKLSYMIGTPRWGMEVRKFYLRHLAFAAAMAHQRRYSAYVYWRDDNYFYAPLDLDNLYFGKNKSEEDPYVIVDKYCENEAYSDKMYIANHQGAALLFSSTLPEFKAWMKRYLLFAFFQKQRQEETLNPQKFIHDVILNADVDRADLSRVDVRYVNGKRCVPGAYFECIPFGTKKYLTAQHDLKACE